MLASELALHSFVCHSLTCFYLIKRKPASEESSDIFIAVMELWTALEIKREIRWEGEEALRVNYPGRHCRNCAVPISSRWCLPGALAQKLAIPLFCVESEIKRMCSPCRTSYYKNT